MIFNALIPSLSLIQIRTAVAVVLLLISSSVWAVIEPPVPAVDGLRIYWEPVDAITINVHTGSGVWLESIPGSETQWLAPSAGEYFLVSADHGDWRDWGRSITVSVGDDDDLEPVRNLRASIYDAQSVEIFWEAAINADPGANEFQVYRNGELVKTCDCQSHYDTGLQINIDYEYTVLPLNRPSVGSSIHVIIPVPGSIGAPENFTSQVYSDSALELFWDRNPEIARYTVYRDDTLVAETDGTSFFDSALLPGTSYTYEVRAFDALDVQGGASRMTVSTLSEATDSVAPPVLDLSSYLSVVREVFDVYSGRTSRTNILRGWQFLNENTPDTRVEFEEPLSYSENYVCLNGTVTVESVQTSASTQTLVAEYDDCLWQDEFLNGEMTFHSADSLLFAEGGQFEFRDFSVLTRNADTISFDGQVSYTLERTADGGDTRTWTNQLERLDAEIGRNIGTIEWRNMDTTFYSCELCLGEPPYSGFSGSAQIRSRETFRNTLMVNTPVPFVNNDSSNVAFTMGQLEISASDNSRIVLDADNDVESDVTVVIYDTSGVPGTEFGVIWDTWADRFEF